MTQQTTTENQDKTRTYGLSPLHNVLSVYSMMVIWQQALYPSFSLHYKGKVSVGEEKKDGGLCR
jgi:hypothetical protein